jgi:hypothetical protein
VLKSGKDYVPGRPQQVPVAVGNREDGAHALQVLRRQHHWPLLGARRQGRRGQRGAHRHHLVTVVAATLPMTATARVSPRAAIAGEMVMWRGRGHQLSAGCGFQDAECVVGRQGGLAYCCYERVPKQATSKY